MERDNILKSVGFSDEFLKALKEFEKSVPAFSYEIPIVDNESSINAVDSSGEITIDAQGENYYETITIRQH